MPDPAVETINHEEPARNLIQSDLKQVCDGFMHDCGLWNETGRVIQRHERMGTQYGVATDRVERTGSLINQHAFVLL